MAVKFSPAVSQPRRQLQVHYNVHRKLPVLCVHI